MTNAQVITKLERIVKQLVQRRDELEAMQDGLGPPLETMISRERRLDERITSINIQLRHLRSRVRERRLRSEMGEAVTPISQARANAMERALEKVSERIRDTENFKAAVRLAHQISEAASSADEASIVTTG